MHTVPGYALGPDLVVPKVRFHAVVVVRLVDR
jgi:hypothetical protein